MRQMKRIVAGLFVVLPLFWRATPAAADGAAQPAGKVVLDRTSVAAGIGVSWGDGTLTFQGHDYPFSVTGLNLLDVGASQINAVGSVYNLDDVRDLEGTYVAGDAGFALVWGADVLVLRNGNGVVITLEGAQQGAKLALGPAGMRVSLG